MLKPIIAVAVAAVLTIPGIVPIMATIRESDLDGFNMAVTIVSGLTMGCVGVASTFMCFAPDTKARPIRLAVRLAVAGAYAAIAIAALAVQTHGYWAASVSSLGW